MYAIRGKAVPLFLCVIFFIFIFNLTPAHAATDDPASQAIIENWEIQWIGKEAPLEQSPSLTEPWHAANVKQPLVSIPEGYKGAWVHVKIPSTSNWLTPGLLVSHLYGLKLAVYEDGSPLYHSERDYSYDRNMLLVAIKAQNDPSDIYMRIESLDRAGVVSNIQIGSITELSKSVMHQELPSLLLGASLGFLAILMLLISGYLSSQQRGAWVSLSLIALTSSIMITTYSSLIFFYFEEIGGFLQFMFDASMLTVFPAFHYYVGTVLEGKLTFFRRFGRWFAGYSIVCFLILFLNEFLGEGFFFYYKLFTFWLLTPWLLVHLLLVLSQSVIQSIRGNKDSIIISIGFLAIAVASVSDIITVYASDTMQPLYRWKIGIVLMIISLVIVLARKIRADHQKLLTYSKELEIFNHQLQRTEKLKFISELAASIAHEVRNPLQVTRGFLQLISAQSENVNKNHFSMAINELDRASLIISDFLTFAKPELENIVPLDVEEELTTVETIMSPLAAINGAVFKIDIQEKMYVLGNPSKFKQAFMNIIKNSIEALQANGIIEIEAKPESNMAVIRIADNGEGMEQSEIARLGEPYFSTKTKGTGLGLMVTFRIIEVMKGTLEFRSEKGKGTEVWIRFPLTEPN